MKESTGGLTAAETEQLVAGVHTVFRATDPLPDYPTPADCERGPRRLAYRPMGAESAAYWHTVPAGTDATGRPGNVFAHVILDRDAGADGDLRPVQRWRSPGWVRPYGAPEIARAVLPPAGPGRGGHRGERAVIRAGPRDLAPDPLRAAGRGGGGDGRRTAGGAGHGGGGDGGAVDRRGRLPHVGAVRGATELLDLRPGRRGARRRPKRTSPDRGAAARILARCPRRVVIDETAVLSMGELGVATAPHPDRPSHPGHPVVGDGAGDADRRGLRPVVLDDIDAYAAEAGHRGLLAPAWPAWPCPGWAATTSPMPAPRRSPIARCSPAWLTRTRRWDRRFRMHWLRSSVDRRRGVAGGGAGSRGPGGRLRRRGVSEARDRRPRLAGLQPATVPLEPAGRGREQCRPNCGRDRPRPGAGRGRRGPEPLVRLGRPVAAPGSASPTPRKIIIFNPRTQGSEWIQRPRFHRPIPSLQAIIFRGLWLPVTITPE